MRAGLQLSENGNVQSVSDLRKCTELIRDRVLARLNTAIAGKLVESVNVLRETYTATLTRSATPSSPFSVLYSTSILVH